MPATIRNLSSRPGTQHITSLRGTGLIIKLVWQASQQHEGPVSLGQDNRLVWQARHQQVMVQVMEYTREGEMRTIVVLLFMFSSIWSGGVLDSDHEYMPISRGERTPTHVPLHACTHDLAAAD